MLSKMESEGADYDAVLKEAQALGYAEANPAADVEGHDACRKIAIWSSLMMGMHVDSEKIYTEGITKITAADFAFAKAANKTIKLLATSTAKSDESVLAMVSPVMIGKDHPLAMVNDVFNAVFVTGNMLGDSMYYGKGAGKYPTASAVVSDVVDCARHLGKQIMCFWDAKEADIVALDKATRKFYIRADKKVLEQVKALFPQGEVLTLDARPDDFAYFTKEITEEEFAAKARELGDALLTRIRVDF